MVNSKGGENFFCSNFVQNAVVSSVFKIYQWIFSVFFFFFFYTNLSKYSPIQFDYIIQLKYTIEEVSQIPIPKKQA